MLDTQLKKAFLDAAQALSVFCSDNSHFTKLEKLSIAMAEAFNQGNKLLICGNGGSACDAMHFAEELTGRFRQNRRGLPAIALTCPGHLTCCANDFGFDQVFARGVEAHGRNGDWLILLSTSGHSANILKACEQAKKQDILTLALLGKDGGLLNNQCDEQIIVPGITADRIQEMHMLILHTLVEGIERVLFPEHYRQEETVSS